MSEKLNLKVVNGRTVRLTKVKNFLEEVDENNNILRLYDNSGVEICLGDTITVPPKYLQKVNYIHRGKVDSRIVCYDLLSTKMTVSSTFVTPFLGVSKSLMLWDKLFVNTYISAYEHTNCISLLYRFSGDTMFLKFETALCSFRTFIKKYDPDPHHVLFVFDVPDVAKKSYDSLINGKYSEIDDLWKLKILDFHDYDRYGQTGQILYKDIELRHKIEQKLDVSLDDTSELHSTPNIEGETYHPDMFEVSKVLVR